MSRNNLFELEGLSQSQSDLIPERERAGEREMTGIKARPKPRPRTILTRTSTRSSNDSLNLDREGSGIQNEAFALDEYTISSSGDHDHDFKAKARAKSTKNTNDYVDTFPSRLVSSTFSATNANAKAKDPFAVSGHSSDAGADTSSTTTKFSEKFKIERETSERSSLRRPKPKPKPRTKSQDLLDSDKRDTRDGDEEVTKGESSASAKSDSEDDSEGTSGQSVVRSRSSKAKPSKAGDSEEYLVIPVAEPEGDDKINDKQAGSGTAAGFLGKWKKAIKTFSKDAVSISSRQSSIKRKPHADDVDVEARAEAGIEEQTNQQEKEKLARHTPEQSRKKFQSRSRAAAAKADKADDPKRTPQSSRPPSPSHSQQKSSASSASASPQHSTHSSLSKRDLHRRVKESEFSELLGITIHKSDPLPADPFCTHPVVKVTLMNQDGSYISKRKERITSGRGVNQGGRGRGGDDSDSDDGRSKRGRRGILSRSKSSASSALAHMTNDAILPMLTQPYQFPSYSHKQNFSIPVREPAWNELILFDEPFSKFVHEDSNCIFFFEIMDFLPVDHIEKVTGRNRYSGSEMGWHKVAWAFLKPVGVNGVRNVNRKLRLQLYKPERLTQREAEHGPEVYCWWKFRRQAFSKLDAITLHVTVKGIAPPSCPTASLQTLLAMRKEELTEALIDSQLQDEIEPDDRDLAVQHKHGRARSTTSASAPVVLREPPVWSRLKGQSCKPPNKLLKALPSSDLDSLKISVSGNVHCVRFSPCGQFLAAGFDTEQMHTVLIFEIPSAVLLKSLRCHHGLIYDLTWRKQSSGRGDDQAVNCLATASADSTAAIWRCKLDGRGVNVSLAKTLLHPSFVYCIRFHPKDPNLVATGCFDRMIRIWNVESRRGSIDGQENDSSPVIMLDNHSSFVNCLEFHPSGKYLYAGDGEGSVYQWKCSSSSKRWGLDRSLKLLERSKRPINSITIHPVYGNKLLVHSRESCLKILDVETFLVLQTFHGFKNERFNIGSTFSPCGNLVLCGSEDSSLCIWDADTSRILQFVKPVDIDNAVITSVDYHPHDFYVAIGVLSANSSSVSCPILFYTYEQPPKLQVSTLVKLKQIARTHQKSSGGARVNVNDVNEASISTRDSLKQEILSNRSNTTSPNPKSASFVNAPQESVDSTDKFMSILSKLDTALKVTNTMMQGRREHERGREQENEDAMQNREKAEEKSKLLKSPSPSSRKAKEQRPSTATSQRSTKSGREIRADDYITANSENSDQSSNTNAKDKISVSSKRVQGRQKIHVID